MSIPNDPSPVERAYLALADHFLDGDEREWLPSTASHCVEAGLDATARRSLYFDHVLPRFGPNLLLVAGTWGAWNETALLAELRASGFDGTPRSSGFYGWLFSFAVPGARATFASLERFVQLLERVPVTDRPSTLEALRQLADAYFDGPVRDPAALSDAARAKVGAMRSDFAQAIQPVTGRSDRRSGEARLERLAAQARNREANGVDLAPLLVENADWTRILQLPFSLSAEIGSLLVCSYARFNQPIRAYHDLSHVVEMIATIRSIGGFDHPEPVLLATLFHDAIHDPTKTDSEAESAALLGRILSPTQLAAHVPRAQALVLSTARHGLLEPGEVDADAGRFLDCDLAVLASSEARYDAYEAAIASEHDHVPKMLYRAARRRFLERMLARPRIYFSDDLHAAWDVRARANLRRALASLDQRAPW